MTSSGLGGLARTGHLPEEQELARFTARLEELGDTLAERELTLATLHRELADFRMRYLRLVATRMADLDHIEAETYAILAGRDQNPEAQRAADDAARRARESAEALGDDAETLRQAADVPTREASPELRALYRTAAKAVHPDLACGEEDRKLRERVMAEVNAAYEAADAQRLQAILDEWQARPEAVSGDGPGAELVRVIRAIAAVEARLAAIDRATEDLRASDAYTLYVRAVEAREGGRDLLREMADELDRRIAAARERLQGLRS